MGPFKAFIATLFACVCLASGAQSADPDSLVAAGSVGGTTGSHGWTVIRAESIVPWALVHTPPRSASGSPGASAQDGVARVAASLGSEPTHMAAVSNRVYMAFAVDTIGSNGKRRILSVKSVRNPVSGLWVTDPQGRFDAFESLPAEGRLHDLASLIEGPLALMSFPVPGGEALSLRFLQRERWIDVQPPEDAAAPRFNMRWSAFAAGEGCVLVGRSGTTLEVWRTPRLFPESSAPVDSTAAEAVPAPNSDDLNTAPAPLTPNWSDRLLISVPPALQSEVSADWSMAWHADELVCGVHVNGSLRFVAWSTTGGWRDVAQLDGVPPRAAVFALRDCGRLVAMWASPKKGESSGLMSGRVPLEREIREVSIATGKQMYSGPLKLVGPVSGSDYRFVMTALLMVSATVLLFVLRPDDTIPFQLPDGFSLAESPRRLFATFIDFALVFFSAWLILGVPASEITLGTAWREHGPEVFFYSLAAACILNTLLEGLTGTTLGKRLTGCRVVCGVNAVGDPPRPPGIGRAFLRNAVKWGLPPLAVMGLIDPEGRGRGDQLARTAVAIETPPEEPLE